MARRTGGPADLSRRRTQRAVALNPIVIERLRRSGERRAVENDLVVGQPDCCRPPAVLNSGGGVAAHAVVYVHFHRRERAFRFNTCLGVPCEHRAIDRRPPVIADGNPEIGILDPHVIQDDVNYLSRDRRAGRTDWINLDAGLAHVAHGCVGDEQLTSAGTLFGNAARRAGEIAVDQAIFDENRTAGNSGSAGDADSDQAGVDAVDIDVAQANGPSRPAPR